MILGGVEPLGRLDRRHVWHLDRWFHGLNNQADVVRGDAGAGHGSGDRTDQRANRRLL